MAQINGPVSAQPVTDAQTGKIVRFEYYADQFGSVVDRKTLVAADAAGTAIAGDPITLTKITVDLDDERSTKPIYLDN
ncbi:UNVERIFIED_CONTAM: hypothetical protein RF648_19700 [Kocuria sp. CPCC 205274]|uniref:MucBP domain-containing protein n=1 Tax=Herbiconiux daphne TaxID=2970914 RepID=A0ABT2H9F6_9MICO|nr:hypothetical protein [Herbiconiux daphne]MCS5736575.1 hypothetical protein [Herbiconiux daphne]